MNLIKRAVSIGKLLKKERVLIIYGPRRAGKTTLLKSYLNGLQQLYKWCTGDDIVVQKVLGSENLSEILSFFEGYDLIAIDEAQNIKNIGQGLKLLVDNKPGVTIVITGSSSFNIEQKTGEPLTGRKRTVTLFPFSQPELLGSLNEFELKQKLEEVLLFGSYPEIFTCENRTDKIELLRELTNSYLLKDIFSLTKVRGEHQFLDLLKLLAFQIGNEVSVSELAAQLPLDTKTVRLYLDLLERTFVLKKLTPFSGNLRKEITGKAKYYFLDNGVRNAVISQFNPLTDRNDTGQLFENFVMMERMKYVSNNRLYRNMYFWRTYQGQEIDLIEEYDGKLFPFEIKWNENAKIAKQTFWKEHHTSEIIQVINRMNYLSFLR
ncbi:MAG: ATP-binding protein [Ignavibacteriales bacterium]|nr:ATP-binding protein [Ignavibacteriales bacterium]